MKKSIYFAGLVATAPLLMAFAQSPQKADMLDISMLPLCVDLAADPQNEKLQKKLESHPVYGKLRNQYGESFKPDYDLISDQQERLAGYKMKMADIQSQMPDFIKTASEFVGKDTIPQDLKINLLCGGQYDGYGFSIDGKLELFMDASLTSLDFFPSLMRHEFWHIAFKTKYNDMGKEFAVDADGSSALRYLAYQLINEGVGHYYSFRRRLEPEIVYDNWNERTTAIFNLANEKVDELEALDGIQEQDDMLFSSHAGVPFWKKWGAVPGAIITYRLKSALGVEAVGKAISQGPCGFLTTYRLEAQNHNDWELLPEKLEAAACKEFK